VLVCLRLGLGAFGWVLPCFCLLVGVVVVGVARGLLICLLMRLTAVAGWGKRFKSRLRVFV
jgi:hypothetical protein